MFWVEDCSLEDYELDYIVIESLRQVRQVIVLLPHTARFYKRVLMIGKVVFDVWDHILYLMSYIIFDVGTPDFLNISVFCGLNP